MCSVRARSSSLPFSLRCLIRPSRCPPVTAREGSAPEPLIRKFSNDDDDDDDDDDDGDDDDDDDNPQSRQEWREYKERKVAEDSENSLHKDLFIEQFFHGDSVLFIGCI